MKSSGQRKLAAIMFTDIVGYSALTQRDEALAMALLEEHFALLRSIFPRFEGTEIKTIGDAFLVEFRSSLQAARCAIEIQKQLQERNQKEEEERRLVLRVGLHVGDILHSAGDVFGDGVNIAARIEPCAPPGGICLSEDMVRPIRNKLDYPLIDLGEKQLKNISEPMRLYAVHLPWLEEEALKAAAEKFRAPQSESPVAGGTGRSDWLSSRPGRSWALRLTGIAVLAALALALALALWWPSAPPTLDRLALLPLSYKGPPEKSATAKMLPALLVESFRSSPEILVTPFDTSRQVPPETEPNQATHELNVDWVLRGDLEILSGRYGLQFALMDEQGRPRWRKRLDGEADQVFGIAEEVTSEVQSALGVGRKAFEAISRNQEAIRFYLEGKSLLEGWDLDSNPERAREAFQKAVQLDAEFGEAHAGLALATWRTYEETRDAKLVALADRSAQKAIELIPENPEAHLAMGVIQLGRGMSQEAVLSFKNALDRAPANDAVCRQIGDAYSSLGRDKDAEAMFQMAIDLKPEFWENYLAKGNFYLDRGRYEEAKPLYRKVVELRPKSDVGHNNLALAHLSLGELQEAESHLKAALEIQPNFAGFTNLGVVLYSRQNYAQAAEQFQRAVELSDNDPAPWLNLGDAQRQLKKPEAAMRAYEKAIALASDRLRINPADESVRASLAYAQAGAGRCEQAKREATTVSQENRGDPMLSYYTGVAFALCGADDQAAQQLQQAIQGGLVTDVRSNPDLQPLLDRPAIKKLIDPQGQG